MFGNVRDVLRLGMALLDAFAGRQESWLRRDTVRGLVAERANGSLRLGFDGKSAQGSSAGATASSSSFGHLGFTGTSFWCDPLADAVTVLLTNRVCPSRHHGDRIRACRPRVHEALFARAARAH
jgi:CubicO group peptidase (beta-lactamase class C family)